jgi:DNA-directed RNA polymerase sigma subunit (sigma70/sigma32)
MKRRFLSNQSGGRTSTVDETQPTAAGSDTGNRLKVHLPKSRCETPQPDEKRLAPETVSATPPQSSGPFKTKSGLDVTQRVTGLLWLAYEWGYLTFESVHQAFSGEDLTPDDMAAVCRMIGQAGVEVVDASAVDPVPTAAQAAAETSVRLNTQRVSVQNCVQQMGKTQLVSRDAESALFGRMEEADQEMRRIFFSFGFAAHEHIAQAEKLLAHPPDMSFDHLVGDLETQTRVQYLRALPDLVRQVRVLDQRAAAKYAAWRQTLSQPNGEEHRIEFRRLDRKLQQTLTKFRYQTKVIQEMTMFAQNISAKFQASLRVLQQAQRCQDSVCQMPLVDVERQTIETMEEFVRMPCEVFLRNFTQLKAAETKFQQARCELIRGHLHLATSVAGTYSNRGLTPPELIRLGVVGLVRAADSFRHRQNWKFSAYAARWIRQTMRGARTGLPINKDLAGKDWVRA